MSDVFASLASGTLRSTGNAPAGSTNETAVRVIDPSPDLSRLTTGENLRGTVVGKDDHGHLLVRTRLGVLQLAAHRSLPVGSEVILQVRSIGPQVVLNLLPLDGTATAGSRPALPQTHPAAQTPQAQGSPALPPNPHDLVQRGQVIRAVLHAAAPLPLLAGLPTAQPGAELLVRILSFGVQSQTSVATPAASGATSNPTLPGAPAASGNAGGNAAPAAAPTTPGPTPSPGAAPAAQPGAVPPGSPTPNAAQGALPNPAQAGTTTTTAAPQSSNPASPPAPADGAAPSGNAAAPATPAASGNATPAATAGSAPAPGLRLAPQTPVANSGHTVATALQSVSSEAAARAAGENLLGTAPGSGAGGGALRLTGLVTATGSNGQPILHTALGTVTLDTRASLPPGSSLSLEITLPAAQNSPAAQALAAAWPSLEALEETLFHSLPPAQMEAVARALPQIGPRLASGVLFFLSALNQGNPLGWLAPAAAAAAERGEHRDLFERLGRDFAGLNRAIETPAGEWRFVNLPLWSEQGLRELRCFFRHQHHGDGKSKGDGDKATRFVLELELQRHGELQLDGLVRGRRFDLMLRSRRPLPAVARGDLLALFEEANAIAGYTGQLVFQASGDWLQMLAAQADDKHLEGLRV